MSLRWIARDLYRYQQKVDALENALTKAPWDEKAPLNEQLRKAKAERDRLRNALEAKKEPSGTRQPR